MLHEFSRTELLIGTRALDKLAASTVAVFGIGGVGSFAVEALVRSGVGRLVLVDNDCVCLTNLNRQLIATHATIGRPKVEIMRERIASINPQAQVIIYQRFYLPESGADLISTDYDYIIDATDTVTAKIDLVVSAQQRGIPIISCMGAGNKLDPTRFEIADIYATSVCPLAKVMRRELRKRGVAELKVVYSREEPLVPQPSDEAGGVSHCAALTEESFPSHRSRRSIPGSMAFVASVAGLIMAGEVIKDLIKTPS